MSLSIFFSVLLFISINFLSLYSLLALSVSPEAYAFMGLFLYRHVSFCLSFPLSCDQALTNAHTKDEREGERVLLISAR